MYEEIDFPSPFWLPEKHSQTIFPYLFRRIYPKKTGGFLLELPDHDQVWVDEYRTNENFTQTPLLIISHGLEGNSEKDYVKGLVSIMLEQGWNCWAWNYRSCGKNGKNKQLRFYHSGAIEDLDFVINTAIKQGANNIHLAGFSLGGNLSLKWLGEIGKNRDKSIRKAVVFSVPLHLSDCSKQLQRFENRIYALRFIQSLKKKALDKAKYYPEKLDIKVVSKIDNLWEFDHLITGPIHGFEGAEDYYQKASSVFVLDQIEIPTFIINAKNDPFLGPLCFPKDAIKDLKNIHFLACSGGGHCGFYQKGFEKYLWNELKAREFFLREE